MRKIFVHIISVFVCVILVLSLPKPGQGQSVEIHSSFTDTMICVNGKFNVPIKATSGFADTNTFFVELSNNSGSFSTTTLVGTLGGNDDNLRVVQCMLPPSVTAGTGYRIRVRANYPTYVSSPFPKTIRVSDYPKATVGSNGPLCVGDNLNLTANSSNFSPTYSWTGPNGFTSNAQNPIRNNTTSADSGRYDVTVTSYKCSATDTVSVLIVPKPVWYGWDTDTFACEGQKFSITPLCSICNLPSSQLQYTWTFPPNNSSQQSTINLFSAQLNNNGPFSVKIQLGQLGNCFVSNTFTPVIKPTPDTPTVTNNGPLCVGDTLMLNGSTNIGGVSFRWEGPNGFADSGTNAAASIYNITKPSEGDYKLYAIKDGCISPAGITNVEVGLPLVPLAITGDTTLCPGEKLQLSAQTNFTKGIEWRKLPGDSIILSQNRSFGITGVKATDAGRYYVTQELFGCKSPKSYIDIIIPDIKNPEASNNGPLCIGEQLKLSTVTTVGGSYSWTGPNGFTSNAQNPTIDDVNTITAGTYKIISTLEYCTQEDSTQLVVKPMPSVAVVSSNSPICQFAYLKLQASSSLDSSTYSWTGPNGFVSNEQNPELFNEFDLAGRYTVQVERDGCVSAIESINIATKEGPGESTATSNGPLTEGELLELYAKNSKDSVAFLWTGPDDFTSNEQNPVIPITTYRNSGLYELSSMYNGCTTKTNVLVDIKDIIGLKLDIYPNPNDGLFTLSGLSQTDDPITTVVYNYMGKIMYRGEIIPDRSRFESTIDLKGVPTGIYLLQVTALGEQRIYNIAIIRQ